MATNVVRKDGNAYEPPVTTPPGTDGNGFPIAGYVPGTPVGGGGSGGGGLIGTGAGGWKVPTVAPNFRYPQQLLDQIAQSLQPPMGYGGQFGRWGFSQGTPTPNTAPATWGHAPTGGPTMPVGWGQRPGSYQPAGGGLLGGGTGGGTAVGPATMPSPKSSPLTAAQPSAIPQQGLLSRPSMTGQPPTPAGTGPGMGTGGQAPAQAGWTPNPSATPQQNMASYNAYINQPIGAFKAGFDSQPTTAAKVQYIMGLPPTASSQLMNDPGVQQALGPNWQENFVSGYYNAPPR